MTTKLIPILFTLSLIAAMLGTPAVAAPNASFTVNTTADTVDANPGNGICADADGNCSLRAAVMEANALGGSNTVTVPVGTYTLSIGGRGEDAAATGDLDVPNGDLTITGAGSGTCGAAGVTCVDANDIDRVFHVLDTGTLNLTGVTVTNGNPDDNPGGGIEVDGGNTALTLTNCLVTSNTTGPGTGGSNRFGGGIDTFLGTVTINDSIISNNVAYEKGGGIGNTGGTVEITNSTITGNDANAGGGIYCYYSEHSPTLTISNSAVISNTTSGGSEYGGGIVNGGTLHATNVTISGNTTGGLGGALVDDNSTVETNLSYVTIANNTTNGAGSGAVDLYYSPLKPGSTIFAGNTGGNFAFTGSGSLASQGYNLSDGAIPSATGSDIQNSAAVGLAALGNNGGPTLTMALGAGSAAIDQIASGTNGCKTTVTTDQRGAVRAGQVSPGDHRGGTACEIGAFEYDSTKTPNALRLGGLAATRSTPGGWLAGALGMAAAGLAAGITLCRRRDIRSSTSAGRLSNSRSESQPVGSYAAPEVIYESRLEARAGSPLSLPDPFDVSM